MSFYPDKFVATHDFGAKPLKGVAHVRYFGSSQFAKKYLKINKLRERIVGKVERFICSGACAVVNQLVSGSREIFDKDA